MLSILIPTYNYNVIALTKALLKELASLNLQYEIICIDDASTNADVKRKNKELENFNNCNYKELTKNIGRSSIRNLLAEKANYENLLFLDSDVLPSNEKFIGNYINALQNNQVVFGGIKYPKIAQSNAVLHHKYGSKRETKLDFITQSFAIKKKVFNTVKFDESFKSYGFEDLLFYKSLKKVGITISRINNPIYHYGIVQNNQLFIEKEKESLKTLNTLFLTNNITTKEVKLLKFYNFLKNVKMASIFGLFTKKNDKLLIKNLISKNPSLFVFDIYRLGFFCRLPKN